MGGGGSLCPPHPPQPPGAQKLGLPPSPRACSRRSPYLGGHVSPSGSKVRVSRGPANPAEGRRQGGGGRRRGRSGGRRPGRAGPRAATLLPPAPRGWVCEEPGPACRARVGPDLGARHWLRRSSAAAAPAACSAGGGAGRVGRPGGEGREAAPPERRAGGCCWGEKRGRGPAPSPLGAAPSAGAASELHGDFPRIYSDYPTAEAEEGSGPAVGS